MDDNDLGWFEYNTITRQVDNLFRIQALLASLKKNRERSTNFSLPDVQKDFDFAVASLTLCTNYLKKVQDKLDDDK